MGRVYHQGHHRSARSVLVSLRAMENTELCILYTQLNPGLHSFWFRVRKCLLPIFVDWEAWNLPWGLSPISRHGPVMRVNGVERRAVLKKEQQCCFVLEGTVVKCKAGRTHTVAPPAVFVVTSSWSYSVPAVHCCLHSLLHPIMVVSPPVYRGSYAVVFIISCVIEWCAHCHS